MFFFSGVNQLGSGSKLFAKVIPATCLADKEVCLYLSHPVQDPAAAAKIIGA